MSIKAIKIHKFINSKLETIEDSVSIEEPLELCIDYNGIVEKISITMRTPGYDKELTLGFLYTEGIVDSIHQVDKVSHIDQNRILINIKNEVVLSIDKLKRNFYTTSSCGVCGKSSLDAVKIQVPFRSENPGIQLSTKLILSLKDKLSSYQSNFNQTGGIHASAFFNFDGSIIAAYEDVGRHNALDKLIGSHFINGNTDLSSFVLLLSGRASFELIQKAAMANVKYVCAIGAPSSLAVELAEELGICLIGFLKDTKFNIYTHSHYISN